MLTMRPLHFWSTILRATDLTQRNTLLSVTSITLSHSSSLRSKMFLRSVHAALLTKISMPPPHFRATVSTIFSTSAEDETSHTTASALSRRAALISAATFSPLPLSRSTTATRAPSWANLRAISSPMLRPAPVTMATLFSRRMTNSFQCELTLVLVTFATRRKPRTNASHICHLRKIQILTELLLGPHSREKFPLRAPENFG